MEEQNIMDIIRKEISNGNMQEVNKLLDDNKDIVKRLTSFNGTLLHDAVRYNQMELANRLIDMGIDINVKCPGSAFRGLAINLANNKEMVELLINRGLIPELTLENFPNNPISLKIEHDDLEMFLFWLEYEHSKFDAQKQKQLLKLVKTWARNHESNDILRYLNDNNTKKKKVNSKVSGKALKKFEKELYDVTRTIYSSLIKNYRDMYAFSMVCSHTFDHIYYVANTEKMYNETKKNSILDYDKRYNEEEWGIFIDKGDHIDELSKSLRDIIQENPEENDELIVKTCLKVMSTLQNENYFSKDIFINIHVWDYFSNDEMFKIFLNLNGESKAKEYKVFLLGNESDFSRVSV